MGFQALTAITGATKTVEIVFDGTPYFFYNNSISYFTKLVDRCESKTRFFVLVCELWWRSTVTIGENTLKKY